MKINKISQTNTAFTGDLIVYVPKNISPELETFHNLLIKENIQSLIKDAPFDLFVKENSKGKIGVYIQPAKDEEINPFTLLILEEKISKVKDKMCMDEILEQMKEFEKEIFEKVAIKEEPPIKNKIFIPNKIGRNSQINNKPKSNPKFIKHR